METSSVGRQRYAHRESNDSGETSAILVKAQKDVGAESAVSVRGDDKTMREVKAEQKAFHLDAHTALEAAHLAAEGLHLVESHAVETLLFTTSEGAGLAGAAGLAQVATGTMLTGGGAVVALGLGIYGLNEAHVRGEEQAEALTKDEVHVAMLTQLALPQGFKTEEFAKRDTAGKGSQSLVMKMAGAFAGKDRALVATLQSHADKGTRAASDMIAMGVGKEVFLRANPRVAEAYAEDPAYRAGFDALVWSKDHDAPEAFEAFKTRAQGGDLRTQQTSFYQRRM